MQFQANPLCCDIPKEPPCFTGKRNWVEYLTAAMGDKACRRPSLDGEFQKDFNFCLDCTPQYAARMAEQSRCNPSFHRAPKP